VRLRSELAFGQGEKEGSIDTNVGQSLSEREQVTSSQCLTDEQVLNFVRGCSTESERQAIDRHVDDCEPCRDFVSIAVRTYDAPSAAVRPEDGLGEVALIPAQFATTFRPQAVLAQRYEIRRFLARGGMGEVYEAYDRQLHERVAIKTLPAAVCDSEDAIRALKAEVQLARRVTHANVCRIYDLGMHRLQTGTLLYFLTMEFVEGQTLGQVIRERGALPSVDADRFARALLTGLGAAHSSGILHRDFKSDNIIVRTSPNGESAPVILDFGLARQLDERSRRTGDRALIGTLQYMAPEQLDGARLSKATDIYAFGVVWFEMLTGKRPFIGAPPMRGLEHGKSPAHLSHHNSRVPKALDAILGRCLSPLAKDRFQTAEEVLAALPDSALSPAKSRRVHEIRPVHLVSGLGIIVPIVFTFLFREGPRTSAPELGAPVLSSYVAALSPASPSEAMSTSDAPSPIANTVMSAPAKIIRHSSTNRSKAATPSLSARILASANARAVESAGAPATETARTALPAASSRFRWQNPVQASGVTAGGSPASRDVSAASDARF
jgi:serine/threonine protein kinase